MRALYIHLEPARRAGFDVTYEEQVLFTSLQLYAKVGAVEKKAEEWLATDMVQWLQENTPKLSPSADDLLGHINKALEKAQIDIREVWVNKSTLRMQWPRPHRLLPQMLVHHLRGSRYPIPLFCAGDIYSGSRFHMPDRCIKVFPQSVSQSALANPLADTPHYHYAF